jgi:hypothetical protein
MLRNFVSSEVISSKYLFINNCYRGGTGIVKNEKEPPVIFTDAIHENPAYSEMARRKMTAIIEWEDGFRESQQAEYVLFYGFS